MEHLKGALIGQFYSSGTSGLYYKHMMIVNYDYSVFKFGASLTDDARVIIND